MSTSVRIHTRAHTQTHTLFCNTPNIDHKNSYHSELVWLWYSLRLWLCVTTLSDLCWAELEEYIYFINSEECWMRKTVVLFLTLLFAKLLKVPLNPEKLIIVLSCPWTLEKTEGKHMGQPKKQDSAHFSCFSGRNNVSIISQGWLRRNEVTPCTFLGPLESEFGSGRQAGSCTLDGRGHSVCHRRMVHFTH